MTKVKIRPGRQVTIPASVARTLRLKDGEFIEMGALFGSMIVMLPSKKSKKKHRTLSDKIRDLMEEEAEEDFKTGRVAGPFKSVEELMRDLRS
jgi:bifunctional DNA-binding transcriptional regulator/antitoxin component of YhaV-PrlF toxin-antitoxin module